MAEMLKELDFGKAVLAVRINGLDTSWWREDLSGLIEAGLRLFRLPKIETPSQIRMAEGEIQRLETVLNIPTGTVKLQCILETPGGIENAWAIAGTSSRMESLSFGAEDYCTALGIMRPGPGYALDYPRSRVAAAAAAYGQAAVDTVWSDFSDTPGLEEDAGRSRHLGFSGKSVIHPDQIEVVNRIFSPSSREIEWARRVLTGLVSGDSDQLVAGAFGSGGAMVDRPVIRRAERVLVGARQYGAAEFRR